MATDTADNVFLALKVIGSLRENERLCTQNGVLCVDNSGKLQGLLRWYYNESRSTNVETITKILSNAFSITDHALQREEMYKQNVNITRHFLVERESNAHLLRKCFRELNEGISGLNNLLVTYKTDTTTVAKIRLLIEKINDRVQLIKRSINSISCPNCSGSVSSGGACGIGIGGNNNTNIGMGTMNNMSNMSTLNTMNTLNTLSTMNHSTHPIDTAPLPIAQAAPAPHAQTGQTQLTPTMQESPNPSPSPNLAEIQLDENV